MPTDGGTELCRGSRFRREARRGTQGYARPRGEDLRGGERALRPCLCQRRLSRRFSESPKHPIDCPTSFAENREARATPVTSRTLLHPALSPRHRSSLLSFPVHLLARGIRNGEHAAVQRLREPHATTSARRHPPIPSSLSSPSLPPFYVMLAVVPASMAANSYNLLLFSSLDLSSLFFYNAINFSFSSSSFATSATIVATTTVSTVAVAAAATTIATTSTFQPPSLPSTFPSSSLPPSTAMSLYLSTISGLPVDGTRCIRVWRAHVAFYSLSLSSLSLSLFPYAPPDPRPSFPTSSTSRGRHDDELRLPVRARDISKRFQICTGICHQPRQPSRNHPGTGDKKYETTLEELRIEYSQTINARRFPNVYTDSLF